MQIHRVGVGAVVLAIVCCACVDPSFEEVEVAASATSVSDSDSDGYDSTDCADMDPAIHPNLPELPNGIDDNCSGAIDEPMLSYNAARPVEGSVAQVAPLFLRITDAATLRHLDGGILRTIKYQLTYQALSSASTAVSVTWITSHSIAGNWRRKSLPILAIDPVSSAPSLQPRTVYRMRIQLFGLANQPLGVQSDWFYTVTGGTTADPSTPLEWGRVDLVSQALDQLGDSLDGLVGEGGSLEPDGSRYTGSALTPLHHRYHPGDDLMWCDWFYHYIGVRVTDPLDGVAANPVVDGGNRFWHEMNPNNVNNTFRDPRGDGCGTELVDLDSDGVLGVIGNGCQDHTAAEVALDVDDNAFYSNRPNNIYYDATASLPQHQALGNFQAMASHVGVFLAFDPDGDGSSSGAGTIGTVWSIEGNVGNRVAIKYRPSDSSTLFGFGKLAAHMFAP